MANWIHRTTYRFRKSWDPPILDQPDYLNLGGGHPAVITGDPDPSHWKVVGESVVLKGEGELLPDAKAAKRAEIISWRTRTVEAGYVHNHNGTDYVLALDIDTQSDWSHGVLNQDNASMFPMKVWDKNNENPLVWNNKGEMLQAYSAALTFKLGVRAQASAWLQAVKDAVTLADVAAIVVA